MIFASKISISEKRKSEFETIFSVRFSKLLRIWLIFLTGFSYPLFADFESDPVENLSSELRSWVALYELGWKGDDDSLNQFFEEAVHYEKDWKRDPYLQAVYGSACIARARLVSNFQKPRWLRRGGRYLDAAVSADPKSVGPRFLRAISFTVLPRRAEKTETVREDFKWLLGEAEERTFSQKCRQQIFYHAGVFELRNRNSEAVLLLRKASELEPENGLEREQVKRMLQMAERQFRKD